MEYNIFRIADEQSAFDISVIADFLNKNKVICSNRYLPLERAYRNDYEIFHQKKKEDYKPDNRVAVNFAKYIADTMTGFFIGVPVKTTCDDAVIKAYVEMVDAYNDQDDGNAELAKITSIYGRGYEMLYVDENGQIGITHLRPTEAFMIYDDSVLQRPRAFVRYYLDSDNYLHGSVSDETTVRYFTNKGSALHFTEEENAHGFDGVPAVEYVENEERMGIYESAMPIINAYNKALSEKANDVDYFSDAYLKIVGPHVDEKAVQQVRSNRILNIETDGTSGTADAEFMGKPSADTTQENLLNRLERQIFSTSMVANINDENFGTASGIAIRYRLWAMSALAQTKERKFTSGMNRRYKLIFSNPASAMPKDGWTQLHFSFTRNYPANLSDEADIASKLAGITSKETQLGVLSCVDDAAAELQRMREEEEESETDGWPTARTDGNEELQEEPPEDEV